MRVHSNNDVLAPTSAGFGDPASEPQFENTYSDVDELHWSLGQPWDSPIGTHSPHHHTVPSGQLLQSNVATSTAIDGTALSNVSDSSNMFPHKVMH